MATPTTTTPTTMRTSSTPNELTPAGMAERTGVSIDTLRDYEREGLIEPVRRADSGHRRYSIDDVLWIEVLRCLRDTGMTIEKLRHYCELGRQGTTTEPERRALLVEHRAEVEAQIAERQEALRLIDHKLSFSDRDGDVDGTTSAAGEGEEAS